MHFTFLSSLLSSPWLIDANTFNTMYPLFNGMLNGMAFQAEGEPQNSIPFHVLAASHAVTGMDNTEANQKLIHVLPVRGIITKHDQPCGPVGTRTLGQRFAEADANPNVIGHILLGESGGGQANAIPELREPMQKRTKPVLGYIDGVSASAMYYLHSGCDEIMASRDTDIVGSTGTMMVYEGRKAVSEANSDGVVHVRIYADGSEEKNLEYEQAINHNNFKPVKDNFLNPHRNQFIADVKASRPNVTDKQILGGVMQAKDAVGTLIDSIGTFDDAVTRVLELAGYQVEEKTTKSSSSNSNPNKSVNHMNPKLSALVALLAISSIEIVEGHAHLSEEQLEAISAGLDKIPLLESQLQAANDLKAKAEADLTAATETIALRDATITEKENKIAELKGEPGTKGAVAITEGDDDPKEKSNAVATGENIVADINAVANEYLGGK
ncbi:MAG: S49 family peptidase [Salinivirgaceae bacterium]|jgi:protease-4